MIRRRLPTACSIALALAVPAPAGPRDDAPSPSRGLYLIAHAEHLADAAAQWAAYRAADGWDVLLRPVPDDGDSGEQRETLRRDLRETYRAQRAATTSPVAVLLLGDAAGRGGRGIPTWRFDQPDPILQSVDDERYATDHPYQLMDDDDEAPDVALGRVPVATNAEALLVLEKIRAYESAGTPGTWRRRVTYVAGEGHFGLMDNLLEQMFRSMVDQFVPDPFDVSVTYAKASSIYCPPPSAVTDTVLDRLSDGALLFNYIGHGNATRFDSLHWNGRRIRLLTTRDLARLPDRSGGPPIAVLTCCEAGWFDLPRGRRSLAEAMLLHPGGPIAVIAGSRITHPYANIVLQKDLSELLLVKRVPTVGELDQLAASSMMTIDETDRHLDALAATAALLGRWDSSLSELRRVHVQLYNLFGDPALRIAHPALVSGLALDGLTVRGRADGVVRGRVHLTVETDRASLARPENLNPPLNEQDPELERKAAGNYPLVNDRTLLEVDGGVTDGRFEVTLVDGLPPRAGVIKVWVVGEDESARPREAFGGLRLAPPVATGARTRPPG
jgi:hypothetical protein